MTPKIEYRVVTVAFLNLRGICKKLEKFRPLELFEFISDMFVH